MIWFLLCININSIFEYVVFLDVKIRIMYLILLHDHMESGTSIYPTCQNAFFHPNLDGSTSAPVDPPKRMSDSNIPTLMRLIAAGDKDYKTKNNN